ncbi:S8 family serine peptidase [Candidatus Poribacteria bacterium]|nr:S8 family serine peptidase [Candidatus Poribacteria bacterium]
MRRVSFFGIFMLLVFIILTSSFADISDFSHPANVSGYIFSLYKDHKQLTDAGQIASISEAGRQLSLDNLLCSIETFNKLSSIEIQQLEALDVDIHRYTGYQHHFYIAEFSASVVPDLAKLDFIKDIRPVWEPPASELMITARQINSWQFPFLGFDGKNITVAVIDGNGVDSNNPFLKDRITEQHEYKTWLPDDNTADPTGDHGTHCVGIIAATPITINTSNTLTNIPGGNSQSGIYHTGILSENVDADHQYDLNDDGDTVDNFPILVVDASVKGEYQEVRIDLDNDGNWYDADDDSAEIGDWLNINPNDNNSPFSYIPVSYISPDGTNVDVGVKGVAPGVNIVMLKPSTRNQAEIAIRDAVDEYNADVISMSFGLWEPGDMFNGHGVLQDAVNYAYDQGCVVIKSSGNYGNDNAHASGTIQRDDDSLSFNLDVNENDGWVKLIWSNDPGQDSNLDMEIWQGNNKIAEALSDDDRTGDYNHELISNLDTGAYQVRVLAKDIAVGINQEFHLYTVNKRACEFANSDPNYTISAPGDAEHSLTVGAVEKGNNQVTGYSSRGPVLGADYQQPMIVAPGGDWGWENDQPPIPYDEVISTSWVNDLNYQPHNPNNPIYDDPVDYYTRSSGTSMAAPHVAGAAALLLQMFPSHENDPQAVYDLITENATNLGVAGWDEESGYGLLNVFETIKPPLTLDILKPIQTNPGIAGNPAFPNDINVEINIKNQDGDFIPDIKKSAFSVKIGDIYGTVVNISQSIDRYILQVKPPIQLTEGLYDLVVKIGSIAVDTEQQAVNYLDISTGIDVALILDKSNSMKDASKLSKAKEAARYFVDDTLLGDQIAISAFDDKGLLVTELTLVDDTQPDSKVKSNIKGEIDKLTSGGRTDFGKGLDLAYKELVKSTTIMPKYAVLMTDGQHNGAPYDTYLDDFKDKDWAIYTVGFGGDVDRDQLIDIADFTGGRYHHVENINITAIYDLISARIHRNSVIASERGFIRDQQTVISENVSVDNSVEQVKFASFTGSSNANPAPSINGSNISAAGSMINMTLIRPDNVRIDPTYAVSDPDIEYYKSDAYEFYRIQKPMAGEWKVEFLGASIPSGSDIYNLNVTAVSSLFSDFATAFKLYYDLGEAVDIGIELAEVTSNLELIPVKGATVQGKVIRPDGVEEQITLSENGEGVYSHNYLNTNVNGRYKVEMYANCQIGGILYDRKVQTTFFVGSINNILVDNSSLDPANESDIDDTKPTISASFLGPIENLNSIEVTIDGKPVSHVYDEANASISCIPDTPLSIDTHYVSIIVTDTYGQTTSVKWSFTILDTTRLVVKEAFYDMSNKLLTIGFSNPVDPKKICFPYISIEVNNSGMPDIQLSNRMGLHANEKESNKTITINLLQSYATTANIEFAVLQRLRMDMMLQTGAFTDIYDNKNERVNGDIRLQIINSDEVLASEKLPENFGVFQNYPNPFNPETWIPYQLSEVTNVNITIYDSTGRMVRSLYLGERLPGYYINKSKAAYWDGKNEAGEAVSSGIYFYSIKAGSYSETKKMLMAK